MSSKDVVRRNFCSNFRTDGFFRVVRSTIRPPPEHGSQIRVHTEEPRLSKFFESITRSRYNVGGEVRSCTSVLIRSSDETIWSRNLTIESGAPINRNDS